MSAQHAFQVLSMRIRVGRGADTYEVTCSFEAGVRFTRITCNGARAGIRELPVPVAEAVQHIELAWTAIAMGLE